MGATSSSCCGAQEAPEAELDLSPNIPRLTNKSPRSQDNAKTSSTEGKQEKCTGEAHSHNVAGAAHLDDSMADDSMAAEYAKEIENGIDVNIILQDKSRLKCKVKLDRDGKCLILTCGSKVRNIALLDIKSILHTPQELARVENSAGIGVNEPCAAIHMASGNCIPLFFVSEDSRRGFVKVVNSACQDLKL